MEARPRAASALGVLLALAIGGVLAAVFFTRFEPAAAVLLRLARPLAAASLVLLASLACGAAATAAARAVSRRLGGLADPAPRRTGSLADGLFVGIPVYGTLLGLIALGGFPLDATAILVTLLLAVGGGLLLNRRRPSLSWSVSARDLLLLGPPIAIAFLAATTPVTSPDELVYKLAVPQQYRLHDGMSEFPLNSHSYFPAAFGLASLGALALSGGVAAKLTHFAIYLLTLGVLRRLGNRLDPPAGLWGAAVAAWTPAWMLIAGWGWPDWGIVGLLLLSYERWLVFREEGDAGDAALSALALAGALSARYTALLWLAAFAAALLIDRRNRRVLSARLGLALALVVLAFGGFFYFRNLAWTGSPVAPFLLPESPGVENFRGGGASGWGALLRGDDILHRGIVDDSLGILLPFSVLLSVFSLRGRGRSFADLFAIAAAQLAVFVTLAPLSRLWMTALVPLALLGASVAVRLWREAIPALRALTTAGAALALAAQILLVTYIFITSYDLAPYVVGRETEAQYRHRARAYARTYDWIGLSTSPSSRVLLIGENRTFDLPRPAFSAGNLDGPRLSRYLARFPTGEEFRRELSRLGVTHVLLHRAWYRVRGAAGAPPPDMLEKEYLVEVGPETHAMLARFFASHARLRHRDGAYDVFELAP